MSSEIDLYVFPNPALDDVSVRYAFSNPPSTLLVLFDTLDRRVRQVHSMETGVGIHDLQIDASNLAPSVYYVCLESDSEAFTKQLVVSRQGITRCAGRKLISLGVFCLMVIIPVNTTRGMDGTQLFRACRIT